MTFNLKLKSVPRGHIFTLDGVELVKLDDDGEASFVILADALPDTVAFCDDEEADAPNNYQGSNLHRVTEDWAEGHKGLYEALVEREIDLTTMDGMTDYGRPGLFIRSLTVDEYRKYRSFIPLASRRYWLATGYSTGSSPNSSGSSTAYCVVTSGALDYIGVYIASYYCPRPAFFLKSEIVVSMPMPEEDVGVAGKRLEDYTTAELAEELWNRVGNE